MDPTAGIPGPGPAVLRASSAGLMAERLSGQLRSALEGSARMYRYRVTATALGIAWPDAEDALRAVQGDRAGSSPTEADYNAAVRRLADGLVLMSADLHATVKQLAATTQYSWADLTAAIRALRAGRRPWTDEHITAVLPKIADAASRGPYRLPDVARMIRQAADPEEQP